LPEYMVPATIVPIESLPLTSNGKVNRSALPDPNQHQLNGHLTTPANPVEEVLCRIWSELLGRERVGVNDSFFDLVGHSLLAARLIARIRENFRTELPLRSLFESPTVAKQAQLLFQYETKPGLIEKIARVMMRLEGMSQEDIRAALRRKREKEVSGTT